MKISYKPATSPEVPAQYLTERLTAALADGPVLWLLSGGSAIGVAVAAAKLLTAVDVSGLTVSLIDERYGPVGHADSNWQQLLDAGFDVPGATLHPVLSGISQAETAVDFESFLNTEFARSKAIIGLLGIGPDGHTSGILPHSTAVYAPGLAFAYEGGGYQRVTTTAPALAKLTEAILYVAGEPKWPVLDRLETDLPPAEQPAQLLKTIPSVTIFTDRPEK